MFNSAQLERTQLSDHHMVYNQGLFVSDLTIANEKARTILRRKTGILKIYLEFCLYWKKSCELQPLYLSPTNLKVIHSYRLYNRG